MLSRILLWLSILVLVAIFAAGGALWYANRLFEGPGPAARDGESTTVVLKRGSGVGGIAQTLQEAGVISDPTLFKLGVSYYGAASKLKAGEYRVPSAASMKAIMDLLVSGKVVTYSVTFAEGLTSAMMVRVLNAEPDLVGDPITEIPEEGVLLPETYVFERGDTRAEILGRMKRDKARIVDALWETRADDLPFKTKEEAVILASIVEKETGVAEERPRVAAVFVNRLRLGMRLQSDPTIIYGLTKGEPLGRGLRRSEIDQPTPYNTYVIPGLPPGPICNPGEASVAAVMNPPKTKELYFVADGTGGHVFAETYEEHQRNVRKWREIEAQREREAAERAKAEGEGAGR